MNLPPGHEFTGYAGKLRDSPWLTADLIDPEKDTVVTIEKVIHRQNVEFMKPGSSKKDTKANYGSLKFVGALRELGLNATNLRTLIALFGSSAAAWKGKRVALFVDHKVRFGGSVVSAVRIRAQPVDPSAKQGEIKSEAEPPPPSPSEAEPPPQG